VKIRKQVYELERADVERHPVWEFASDEEGAAGHDEATVRPWEAAEPLDPSLGSFVVRTTFVLADGTEHVGLLTPPAPGGDASIATIQPVLFTAHGHVLFWHGAGRPSRSAILGLYAGLGRSAEQVFPCSYRSDVALVGGPVSGTLDGFMHYRSFSDHAIVELR
jgi:hypothetical protein